MQPCSREDNNTTMSSILSPSSTHSSQIQNASFDPSPPHDDFLDQILNTLPSSGSWSAVDPTDETTQPPLHPVGFHSASASHFSDESDSAVFASNLRQQMMMIPSFLQHGIDRNQNDINGFSAGSLHHGGSPNHPHHFHNPQDLGGHGAGMNQLGQGQTHTQPKADASTATAGTPAAQTKPRVRARRGQATDPHSIAERLRRERIAERMKGLQELVPNANKTDKASMLDEIIDYVKFLQLQVKVLSMSRLGGAASAGPLASQGGGGSGSDANRKNKTASSGSDAGLTVTENQVAKLMREDMGSAMQYLQGKGLCLMPISLATAISTSTCRFQNPLLNAAVAAGGGDGGTGAAGDVPTSPDISALSVSKQ